MFKVRISKRELEKGVIEVLKEVAKEIIEESKRNILDVDAVFRGTLISSDFIEETPKPSVKLGYKAPHAIYVEYGTRPHYPPFKPIYEWVKGKLGYEDPEAKNVAWAIVHKIGKEGTEPRYFLTKAVYKVLYEKELEYYS